MLQVPVEDRAGNDTFVSVGMLRRMRVANAPVGILAGNDTSVCFLIA